APVRHFACHHYFGDWLCLTRALRRVITRSRSFATAGSIVRRRGEYATVAVSGAVVFRDLLCNHGRRGVRESVRSASPFNGNLDALWPLRRWDGAESHRPAYDPHLVRPSGPTAARLATRSLVGREGVA